MIIYIYGLHLSRFVSVSACLCMCMRPTSSRSLLMACSRLSVKNHSGVQNDSTYTAPTRYLRFRHYRTGQRHTQ